MLSTPSSVMGAVAVAAGAVIRVSFNLASMFPFIRAHSELWSGVRSSPKSVRIQGCVDTSLSGQAAALVVCGLGGEGELEDPDKK